MRRLSSTAWLLVKLFQFGKVIYYGLEFLVVLAFTILCYTIMLPFMLIIFIARLIVKPFRKKGEKVNVQSLKTRT